MGGYQGLYRRSVVYQSYDSHLSYAPIKLRTDKKKKVKKDANANASDLKLGGAPFES
jgi:hypothetical protein